MSKVRPSRTPNASRQLRRLASDDRAGSGARRQAARLQLDTLREHKRIIPILVVMYVVVGSFVWIVGGWAREFALGAWTAAVVAMGHHFVWQMSGAVNWELGALGEQWTAQALRKLRSSGWHLVNDVHFKHSNIDHVLVGPGGVIVVETKTSSKNWSDRAQQQWIAKATGQVSGYARSMRNYLKPHLDGAPVIPIVALWPSRAEITTREHDGVTVVSGSSLVDAVAELPGGQMDKSAVDAVCEELARYVRRRDARRIEDEGPAPRSLDDWNFAFLQVTTGLLVGPFAALLAFRLEPRPLTYLAIGAFMVGAVGFHRRFERLTTLATTASVGCIAVVVAVLVAIVANAG